MRVNSDETLKRGNALHDRHGSWAKVSQLQKDSRLSKVAPDRTDRAG